MAQILQDKYILGQSSSQAITTIGQEIRVDLQLAVNTNNLNSGEITGSVLDVNGKPLTKAVVKLMDVNYNPISHAITNSSGIYTLNNVAPGSYSIFAIAQGMSLQQSPQFSVAQMETLTQNLTLQTDSAMTLGIIPGIVTDLATGKPVSGAIVSLFSVDANNNQTLQSVLYTNQYGQFVFRQIPLGNYIITITSLGYATTNSKISILQSGQIAPVEVTLPLSSDGGTESGAGTVSGIITDPNNAPIAEADVILYKVNSDNSLTPVAYTRTNINGVYLFGNVPPANYKVKSSQSQLVNVNVTINYSPNFDYFLISNYSSLSVNSTNGSLAGGATLQFNGQIVGNIGGANSGSVTVSINSPTAGNYIMGVQYINGDATARTLLVDVNGTNTGTTYSVPSSNGANIYNQSIFNIALTLTKGANTVKLYNTTSNGPSLGMIYFAPVTTFNGINGTLANGAIISSNSAFVSGIGTTGGTLTINPTVPIAGQYTLGIQYLAGDAARPIMVSVNGTQTGTSYSCPKTTDWSTQNAGTLNITVNLTSGANTIQFYNSPTASGPWVGMLTMTPIFEMKVYDATAAILSGSATVIGGFVTGIQSGNGSITFTGNVPSAGTYNFGMCYVSPDNSKQCNIAINGTSLNQIYTFTKTVDLTTSNEIIQTTQLTLNSGANTIKIYNQ